MNEKNLLCERIKFYNFKQREDQFIKDYVSEIRLISRYCSFPNEFADEALRDAFCRGINKETVRKAVCRQFALFQRKNEMFTLNDAISAAEIEESASITCNINEIPNDQPIVSGLKIKNDNAKCQWCGHNVIHDRQNCPASSKKML